MESRRSIPTAPLILGVGGLIPFVGLASLVAGEFEPLAFDREAIRAALAAYAVAIASFLGGIRWGFAATAPDQGRAGKDYVIGVVPSLLAWASLGLPGPWALRALGALILLWGLVDQDLPRRGLAPLWFGRLRLGLSFGAGLALLVAGWG